MPYELFPSPQSLRALSSDCYCCAAPLPFPWLVHTALSKDGNSHHECS